MSKPFDGDVRRLRAVLVTLTERVLEAESRLVPFNRLTGDCLERIPLAGPKHLLFYLRQWLRVFIGVRDECMVLLNGEIVRQYHVKMNQDFVQERGKESRFYNDSCSLTLCSTDGIDFEYRLLVKKFGHKFAFESIANQSEELSGRLHDVFKATDRLFDQVSSVVRTLPGCKLVANLKHCGEIIEVFVPAEFGRKIILNNMSLRKCSQAQALVTQLDDPIDAVELQKTNAASHQDEAKRAQRKRRLELEDSDNDETAAPAAPAELDAVVFSVDEIMQSFRPPSPSLYVQESSAPVVAVRIVRHLAPYVEGLGGCATLELRVKVMVTGVEIQPQQAISLSIYFTHPSNLLDAATRNRIGLFASSSDVLDRVLHALLLQHPYLSALLLPRTIQIDGHKYGRGAQIPFPATGLPGRYPVLCESHPQVIGLLEAVRLAFLADPREEEPAGAREDALFAHRALLLSAAGFLRRKALATEDSAWHFDVQCACGVGVRVAEDSVGEPRPPAALCTILKECIFAYVSDGELRVRASRRSATDLMLFCRHSTAVDASGCLLTSLQLRTLLSDSPLLRVKELDLRANPLCAHLSLGSIAPPSSTLYSLAHAYAHPSSQTRSLMAPFTVLEMLGEALEDDARDPWADCVAQMLSRAPQLQLLRLTTPPSLAELLLLLVGLSHGFSQRRNTSKRPLGIRVSVEGGRSEIEMGIVEAWVRMQENANAGADENSHTQTQQLLVIFSAPPSLPTLPTLSVLPLRRVE